MTISAHCITVIYEKGEYEVVQSNSVKMPRYLSDFRKRGYHVVDRNNGWADISKPSMLVLEIEVGKEKHDVWISRFFKSKLGRLTEKRRNIILKTMPVTIGVSERVGRKGTKYFEVEECELLAWLDRVISKLG